MYFKKCSTIFKLFDKGHRTFYEKKASVKLAEIEERNLFIHSYFQNMLMLLKLLNCYSDVESTNEKMEMIALPSYRESKLGKILICFSIYTNTKKLLITKVEGDSIPIFYGIRFLSTIWLIIFHTFFYTLDYTGE